MAVKVIIPSALSTFTKGQRSVQAEGVNLGDLLTNLDAEYPGLRGRLVGDDGRLRRFVNLYINEGEDAVGSNLEATLADGDTVLILPAMAGGA